MGIIKKAAKAAAKGAVKGAKTSVKQDINRAKKKIADSECIYCHKWVPRGATCCAKCSRSGKWDD